MRGLAPKDGEVPFVKNMWRGTLHPGHVLFTPAGCCVGVRVLNNQLCTGMRKHVIPLTRDGIDDLEAVAKIAPVRVSAALMGSLKQSMEAQTGANS